MNGLLSRVGNIRFDKGNIECDFEIEGVNVDKLLDYRKELRNFMKSMMDIDGCDFIIEGATYFSEEKKICVSKKISLVIIIDRKYRTIIDKETIFCDKNVAKLMSLIMTPSNKKMPYLSINEWKAIIRLALKIRLETGCFCDHDRFIKYLEKEGLGIGQMYLSHKEEIDSIQKLWIEHDDTLRVPQEIIERMTRRPCFLEKTDYPTALCFKCRYRNCEYQVPVCWTEAVNVMRNLMFTFDKANWTFCYKRSMSDTEDSFIMSHPTAYKKILNGKLNLGYDDMKEEPVIK